MLTISTTTSLLIIIGFFAAHWYLSLFTQSFFLHRYAAHGQFVMSRIWERVFFVLAFVFQGSSYLSPRVYAIMHRIHHAHSDTEEDPHSPSYSKQLFDMMWKTKQYYTELLSNKMKVEQKFTKNVPDWPAMDRFADHWYVRIAWGTLYVLFYIAFATHWWMYLLLPVHFVMGPFHGVIINWYAHKIGYRNYKQDNTSTNLMPWDIFMWGEGLHNNHHRHPNRPNFARKWWELDPLYPVIWTFKTLGIIRYTKDGANKMMSG